MTARVHLVGAGPGDPGLLTARALELIARADVILYDRLVPAAALDGARSDAELVYVGKRPGESVAQDEIERLLVEHARAGREVVRLKGGDPFVFGRGGEEAKALRAAGIEYDVVPGVTAGIAAPAYAGIPVTHRDRASAVAFVTGHEDPEKPESALDFAALAAFPGTLVFYMGVRELPRIAERLLAAGRAADEPAAVIERGTQPRQRVVAATLATIAEQAAAAAVEPPSLTVVGAVAGLAGELGWLRAGPLSGRTIAVTRARPQAGRLAGALRELGAEVVEAPVIRIVALPGPAPDLSRYDLVCLTSANAVELLFERLWAEGLDARALAGRTVAAIGPGTAAALRARGVIADLVPERAVAEGLVEALGEVDIRHALVARARVARELLPDALRERGADVDVLDLYETVAEPLSEQARAAALGADVITFTSASTVANLLAAIGGPDQLRAGARLASIGPVTTAALREHGLEPAIEAARHDIDGLIEALVADARDGSAARD